MDKSRAAVILITIDVEEWFQVENLRPWFPSPQWEAQASRVEASIHRLLDLLDAFQHRVKATFFVLGWVARKHPRLIKTIGMRGHEVASHGDGHQLCSQMDGNRLRLDLINSKKQLEDLIGREVLGYRAPSFSISDDALKLVRDCGYRYDSSYNSFDKHGRYGKISINGYGKTGIALQLAKGLYELPISNLLIAGQTVPWGGGGYFRLLPPALFNAGVARILKVDGAYLFYMHPWEIDPEQPKVKAAKNWNTWRHYLNLDQTYTRLTRFISRFSSCEFTTCRRYLEL